MNKKRIAYVVIEMPDIENIQDVEDIAFAFPYVVGVFSRESLAVKTAEKLSIKNQGYIYLIEDYELNMVYEANDEEAEREISESLEKMVKEGVIDYKIGEDGQFYFEVVDKDEWYIQNSKSRILQTQQMG